MSTLETKDGDLKQAIRMGLLDIGGMCWSDGRRGADRLARLWGNLDASNNFSST